MEVPIRGEVNAEAPHPFRRKYMRVTEEPRPVRTLLYVSGPYTGEINENIANARKIAVELWGRGYAVLCPHLNTQNFEIDCTAKYEDYIDGDCRMIDGCDGLVLIPGWEKSRGALLEKAHAEMKGIPVSIWPELPGLKRPGSVLLEAEGLVHGNRGADYGHPLDDFSRTAKMWTAILGHPVTANQIGLCMIAVKLSRECNKPKRDNLVDIAGYAETVQMVKDEAVKRIMVDDK